MGRTNATLALAAALSLAAGAAFAQYPEQPIQMIVPWAAGGGTDAIARQLAAGLEQELGVPVSVVNRTGGAGVIGHNAMVGAEPDGYTIGFATAEMVSYYWNGQAEFTHEDVTPIALVNFDPSAFHVRADSEWATLEDALEAIRGAEPGEYTLSGMGPGAAYHLAFAGLLQEQGIDPLSVVVVPSQGAAPGFQELAAGGVDIIPSSLPEGASMAQAGQVKALAVLAEERNEAFPDVPTVEEAIGVPYAGGTWRGVVGPAGLDGEVVDTLGAAVEAVVGSEAFTDFMSQQGFGVRYLDATAFEDFLAEQHEQTGTVMKALNLAQRD